MQQVRLIAYRINGVSITSGVGSVVVFVSFFVSLALLVAITTVLDVIDY